MNKIAPKGRRSADITAKMTVQRRRVGAHSTATSHATFPRDSQLPPARDRVEAVEFLDHIKSRSADARTASSTKFDSGRLRSRSPVRERRTPEVFTTTSAATWAVRDYPLKRGIACHYRHEGGGGEYRHPGIGWKDRGPPRSAIRRPLADLGIDGLYRRPRPGWKIALRARPFTNLDHRGAQGGMEAALLLDRSANFVTEACARPQAFGPAIH